MSGHVVESFKVASTLDAYRIVQMVTGTANTVQYPVTTATLFVGVTTDNVKDTTVSIPVKMSGLADLYFNDTVTCGDPVTADTSGRGVPITWSYTTTSLTLPVGIIGALVDATIANTGTIAKVTVHPSIIR